MSDEPPSSAQSSSAQSSSAQSSSSEASGASPGSEPELDPLDLLRERPGATASDLATVVATVRSHPAIVACALVAVGAVLFLALGRGSSSPELSLPTLTSPPAPAVAGSGSGTTTADTGTLVVHAAGAVAAPGVYELTAGSRIADLVAAAGGLTADADADRLNLAGPVADGQRVYVPRIGEESVPDVVAGDAGSGDVAAPGPAGDGRPGPGGGGADLAAGRGGSLVDVNTATLDELDTLPGIGPATAQAIIDHREANGPFRTVEDLLDVRGIGDAKLEQLRPLVSV